MPYKFEKLTLDGLVLVEFGTSMDERGSFSELYRKEEFQNNAIPPFVQDNFSVSQKGVLRGMHYQIAPRAQGKLIFVLAGEIYDVAVDIRKNSKTFKKWQAITLKETLSQALYIPPGFAHGFLVLSETARVLYKTTSEYTPELERGIVWNDPELNINWPTPVPKVKRRDASLPILAQADLL